MSTRESADAATRQIGAVAVQIAGPALAILAVGSIAWFLVDITYSGPLAGRCKWIFALFSFAAVLISRISIEEGFSRAAGYGFVLALATLMVAGRFMEGNLLALALILGFVWWCAGRLTWDCTFIDQSRDATGQGLIDLALQRLERFRHRRRNESTEKVPHSMQGLLHSINRIFFARRQPNTPGLWAFWFLVGGLPFFGLGQLLIPVSRGGAHGSVVNYVLVYFLSLLGLLMLTSITGLHRYLGKRQAALPGRIARRWLIGGTILALAVTFIALILPRPVPQTSLARLIPRFFSSRLDPTRISVGQDGQQVDDENGGQNVNSGPRSQDEPDADGQGGEDGESGGAGSDSGKGGEKSGGGKSGGDKAGDANSSGNQSQQGNSGTDQSSGGQQGSGKQGGGKQAGGKSAGSQSSQKNQNSPSQPGDKSGDQAGDKSGDQTGDQAGDQSDEKSGQQPPGDENARDVTGRNAPGENKSKTEPGERADGDRKADGNKGAGNAAGEQRRAEGAGAGNRRQESRAPAEPRSASPTDLAAWLRLIVLLAVAIVVAALAIRYRERLSPLLQSLLAELRELWQRLFGRSKTSRAENALQAERKAAEVALPGFGVFQNPFTSEAARQWSPGQIVEYSFRALEAWARDRQIPRHPDQTANEFVRFVGKTVPALQVEAAGLGTLYSNLAYGPDPVRREQLAPLAGLWEKLVALYSASSDSPSTGARKTAPSGGTQISTR